jgi:hypothetical protein
LFLAFLFLAPVLGATAQQSETPLPQAQAKADLLKLAAAGVGDEVLLAYVRNSKAVFNLSVDDIIVLKDDKVGSSVIQAILDHDAPAAAPSPPAAASSNSDPAAAPAPLVEAVPLAPGPGYQWMPGYWVWGNSGWVWVYGDWRPFGFFGWHHRRYYW